VELAGQFFLEFGWPLYIGKIVWRGVEGCGVGGIGFIFGKIEACLMP
jgi:hypothetical protein